MAAFSLLFVVELFSSHFLLSAEVKQIKLEKDIQKGLRALFFAGR